MRPGGSIEAWNALDSRATVRATVNLRLGEPNPPVGTIQGSARHVVGATRFRSTTPFVAVRAAGVGFEPTRSR